MRNRYFDDDGKAEEYGDAEEAEDSGEDDVVRKRTAAVVVEQRRGGRVVRYGAANRFRPTRKLNQNPTK